MANKTDGVVEKSIISSDMRIKGKITASGGLVLLGNVIGDIKCNSLSIEESGILKGNIYVSLCDGQNILETDLSELDDFESMVGVRDSEDITNSKNHLVSSSGDIYSVVCPEQEESSSEPIIENTGLNIVLEEGVKITEGREVASEQFVLLDNGEVMKLEISGSSYVLVPTEFNQNGPWVGLTTQTKPTVFDEEQVTSLTDSQKALLF